MLLYARMERSPVMKLQNCRRELTDLSPKGCYVALKLGFYSPEEELNTFSEEWINHYTLAGHALVDPLMLWCQKHGGCARWSDVGGLGVQDVLEDYQSYGYRYGCVVSILGTPSMRTRSLGIFARSDREPLDTEMDQLRKIVYQLHTYEPNLPTQAQLDALRLYSQGLLQKEIACALNISVGAVKARLRGGADRLNVRTPREAAFIAISRNLF